MLVVRSICRSYCPIPCMTTFSVLCGTNHVPRTSYRFLGRAHLAASLVFYILLVKHVNALAPVNNISYTNKNKLEFEKRNTRLKLIDHKPKGKVKGKLQKVRLRWIRFIVYARRQMEDIVRRHKTTSRNF